jgi:ABC-type sugar transport system substrate-binding protein
MLTGARLSAALSTATCVVALGACGGDDSSSDKGGGGSGQVKGKEVAFNLAGRQIPYYRDLADGMTFEAKREGIKLTSTFGDQQVPTQVRQVENLITRRPDGLVVGPIDQEALIPPYRQASNAKIPIATVSDNIGKDGQQFQLTYVGHAYEELGRKKAKWIVDKLGGKGTVGIIHAIRGGNFTEEQNKGAKAVFKQSPGIKVVDGPYVGDFTADAGLKGTENLLSRTSKLDALYFDNDDIALGGIKGVKERDIPSDKILIVGTDGGAPAIQAVKAGDLDYTVSLCGYAQGVEAIKTLAAYFKTGKKPGPIVKTPQAEYTPDTVESKLKELKKPDCNGAVDSEE